MQSMDPFNPLILAHKPKPQGLHWGVWLILALAAATIVLQGCATLIDEHTPPPADAPKLAIEVRQVSILEIQRRCGKYMTTAAMLLGLGLVGGCAEIYFAQNLCIIWLPSGENDAGAEKHERDHCALKDHPGDSTLRDAWTAYKAGR